MEDHDVRQAVGGVRTRFRKAGALDIAHFLRWAVTNASAGAVVTALLRVYNAVAKRAEGDGGTVVGVDPEDGDAIDNGGGYGGDEEAY